MSENEVAVVEQGTMQAKSVAETSSMVEMIGQLAMNEDVSVDKMERIMAMQERILDRQAQQDFTSAMVVVQQSIPFIRKDRENKQTNSNYANLDSINKVIKPLYTKEGFSLSFGTDGEVLPGTVRITCEVSHIGGHSKSYTYDAPIDDKGIKGTVNKTTTHARGSAVTYGQRYLTKMIFNLTLTDEDDDGNSATVTEYVGDVVAAIQSAKTTDELRELWGMLSADQMKSFEKEVAARVKELS